jgi:hypothetical protein
MRPNAEPAYFTTDNNNPVVCQHCLQSFEDGTEPYFMQDKNWMDEVNMSVPDVVNIILRSQRLVRNNLHLVGLSGT